MRVWVVNWEMQCCGEPFAVGSHIEWGLTTPVEKARSWLAEPLGDELAASVTHFETHHQMAEDDQTPAPTRGSVEAIMAVYWRIAPRPLKDSRVFYPVRDTAVVQQRKNADGWEPEVEGLEFAGYLVDLSPL